MSPSGITNQCVAGALATWALMHPGDPRWNRPRAPVRQRHRPVRGGGRRGLPGQRAAHAGRDGRVRRLVRHLRPHRHGPAVQGDRYEVIEQNFLDFSPALEPHWQTFDLRSIAWPDPAVLGFVVAPA